MNSATTADLVAIARGAGIANFGWLRKRSFDRLIVAALDNAGPSLIAARIDGESAVTTTDRDSVRVRANFMQGLRQS